MKIIGFSGGRDSAALACWAKEHDIPFILCFVDTGYFPPLVIENVYKLATLLKAKLIILKPFGFKQVYKKGFKELREGKSIFKSVCLRCANKVHQTLEDYAKLVGADPWYGFVPRQIEIMDIKGDISKWPYCNGQVDYEQALRSLNKTAPNTEFNPLRTNCDINWLMIDECLKLGRRNPYAQYFRKISNLPEFFWVVAEVFVNLGIKFGLIKKHVIRQLRSELLDT